MSSKDERLKRRREYDKQYRLEHKEERNAYSEWYRQTHKEQLKAYRKAWNRIHKEQKRAYNKKYWQTHKEQLKEYNKLYHREWYRRHKMKKETTQHVEEPEKDIDIDKAFHRGHAFASRVARYDPFFYMDDEGGKNDTNNK